MPERGSRRGSPRSATGVQVARAGTMFGMFFSDVPVTSWDTAKRADTARFAAFHRAMLDRGVYLAPSQFEAGFLSTVHGDAEIDATLEAARPTALAGPSDPPVYASRP